MYKAEFINPVTGHGCCIVASSFKAAYTHSMSWAKSILLFESYFGTIVIRIGDAVIAVSNFGYVIDYHHKIYEDDFENVDIDTILMGDYKYVRMSR